MTVARRLSDVLVANSKVVLVTLLLVTALVGAGASMVDDDSSLEQFESDSPEGEAAEYIAENFGAASNESENTTTVQLIVRGENVLTKESLLESLEFQQQIREHETIGPTLTENDSIIGVENLLVTTAIIEDRIDELEAEAEALNESADELEAEAEALNESADELEAEAEALNESADELEAEADNLEWQGDRLRQRGAELEERGEQLEADGEALAQDQAALEVRAENVTDALNETRTIQTMAEQGAITQAQADDQVNSTLANASANATLNATQESRLNATADEVRDLVNTSAGLEQPREAAYQNATEGVFDDPGANAANISVLQDAMNETGDLREQYAALNQSYQAGQISQSEYEDNRSTIDTAVNATLDEARSDAQLNATEQQRFNTTSAEYLSLAEAQASANVGAEMTIQQGAFVVFEEEFTDLEQRGQELEQRGQQLEEDAESLENRGRWLGERGDGLEERADELEEWGDDLERRGEELEERGDELERRGEDLEERGDELEAAFEELEEFESPPVDEQIAYLESIDQERFERAINDTLGDEDNDFALGLMASSYEPGSLTADARMTFITQTTDNDGGFEEMGGMAGPALDAQLELRSLADDRDQEYVVFGFGVITDEIDRSMGDSLAIVGPLALLFVVVALVVAYRDPIDIVLGVAGIVAVLVWTFGFMGWAGIAFNQMFIAVPVLLIGLSIDYAIHVFMRQREQREAAGVTSDVRGSMGLALAGVGVALLWVTATTAIGFLANLVSPIGPIREFGIVSAVGILSAMIVFGALVPAAKVEIDTFLEARGFDRRRRAFGTGGGGAGRFLTIGSTAARRAPLVVLLVVLLLTAGGVYGATQVDTSFDEEDFLAESPPAWTQHLGPLSPGEYHAKADLEFVNEHFQREDSQAQLLVEGTVTDDETLERVSEAETAAANSTVAYILPNGNADVESPLSVMEDVASDNESFNDSFTTADRTGDGVPDENLEALYDELFEVDEAAASEVLYRSDEGEYEALRLIVAIRGDAAFGETTTEMRAIAAGFDDGGTDPRWVATATGDPIVSYIVEQDLLDTVLESLLITLVAVFAFLTLAYRAMGNSATLGAVTLLPVAFTVSWILGTMYLLGMPFNVLTGMITSLTIGLGVAYSVHISSRYTLELERQGNVWDAMYTTVTGTGGALLGSAATTVGGFGTLALAILPVLRQFGIITGLTIIYAFLASVVVLPTLLVLWTRYFGPDVSFSVSRERRGFTPTASDGGHDEEHGGER
ncbi:MMPL family transporter [Natronobiforma cellulositropha]|uniref:MMPL family transporter n=1 Tax=Natronobiforma cellulositropha TaxID=1679076 RepID=UPI0021D5898B|nr:MMPL family transporter [Natronobiforma cellulositropha]